MSLLIVILIIAAIILIYYGITGKPPRQVISEALSGNIKGR